MLPIFSNPSSLKSDMGLDRITGSVLKQKSDFFSQMTVW